VVTNAASTEHHLLTLVHISDLHVGILEDHSFDAAARTSWQKFKFLDGLLGHDGNALIRTAAYVHELRNTENADIVVTGDLTSMGRDKEFENVTAFLSTGLTWGRNLPIGLNSSDWRVRTIPGNHDHWPGDSKLLPMFGPPSGSFNRIFNVANAPICTWSRQLAWPGAKKPVTLTLFGVDSDADVHPLGVHRFLARGSFRSELAKLRGLGILPPIKSHEVRVLLLHHSPSWTHGILGTEKHSSAALEQFLGGEDFRLVLTGHTHEPVVNKLPIRYKGQDVDVWEACCGSTTQRVDPPYEWGAHARRQRNRLPRWNSMIVHRFYGVGKSLRWRAQVLGLRRDGWACCPVPPATIAVDRNEVIWREKMS